MAQYQEIWTKTAAAARQALTAPAVFRALDRAVPLAWENGVLVVGLAPGDGAHAGTLNTGDYSLRIEQVLRQTTGNPSARFRVIEGATQADWDAAKLRDAAGERMRAQAFVKKAVDPSAISSWETLADQVSQLWAEFEFRTMPSGKGRFLQQVLALIDAGMENVGAPNENTERAFSRVLERVASMTGSDPAVLAYLLFERRRARGVE